MTGKKRSYNDIYASLHVDTKFLKTEPKLAPQPEISKPVNLVVELHNSESTPASTPSSLLVEPPSADNLIFHFEKGDEDETASNNPGEEELLTKICLDLSITLGFHGSRKTAPIKPDETIVVDSLNAYIRPGRF